MVSTLILVALSVAVGLPRVLGQHSEMYQAIAHVYVGGLGGAWIAERRRLDLVLLLVLSALEVACFLYYGKQ